MTERRQIERRKRQKTKVWNFPSIHVGRRMWMCFIVIFLMLGGYVHSNIHTSENFSTYIYGLLGVLGIFCGAATAGKFSPYSSSDYMTGMNGIGRYPPQNFGGGMPNVNLSIGQPNQYPLYQPQNIGGVSTLPQTMSTEQIPAHPK